MLIFPALVALPNLSCMVQVTMAMPHAAMVTMAMPSVSMVTIAIPYAAMVTMAMPPAALLLALLGVSQDGLLVAAALPALSRVRLELAM